MCTAPWGPVMDVRRFISVVYYYYFYYYSIMEYSDLRKSFMIESAIDRIEYDVTVQISDLQDDVCALGIFLLYMQILAIFLLILSEIV